MSNGMNRMNKGELLTFIDEVTFALDDLTLYLDTHPHCEKALGKYETYKAMRNQAVKDYVNMYGHGKGSVIVRCGYMKRDFSFL